MLDAEKRILNKMLKAMEEARGNITKAWADPKKMNEHVYECAQDLDHAIKLAKIVLGPE